MADFGATQPRLFVADSSRPNGLTLGNFKQGNNRYTCRIELYDYSVPVTIPTGASVTVKCRADKPGSQVYVLDKAAPDFATIVKVDEGANTLTIDRWPAMVETAGKMLLGIDIDGMSTYVVGYTVDADRMADRAGRASYHPGTPVADLAKADLSNLAPGAFEAQAKALNLAKNDLEDVDLGKLAEKVNASDVGKELAELRSAVSPAALDRWLRQDPAFAALAKSQHPAVSGLTPDEVKALFFANRFEVQRAVDLTKVPYKDPTTLLMVYQLTSDDQIIKQTLPAVSSNQVVMVEVLRSTGVTGGAVEFAPRSGDMLDGSTDTIELDAEGYCGYFLPVQNENSYDLIREPVRGETRPVEFVDTITGGEFTAPRVQSADKTIRISQMPVQGGGAVADLSVQTPMSDEGVMATLGFDELVNSKYPNARLYFGDLRVPGGAAIHPDMQTKSFVIQDADPNDDPNVSGGTLVALCAYLAPADGMEDALTQDGAVRLEWVDDKGDVLTDVNGDPVAVQSDYKSGDKQRPELLVGVVRAKASTRVHLRISTTFAGEEILSAGSATAVCVQAFAKDSTGGRALDEFEIHTGAAVRFSKRYYGENSMNLAQVLTFAEPVRDIQPTRMEFGDGMALDIKAPMRVGIENYQLNLNDNGSDLPVFSVVKHYGRRDMAALSGKSLRITFKGSNARNAVDVALLKYTGAAPAPAPCVESYSNGSPVFPAGWSSADALFVTELASGEVQTRSRTIAVPDGAKELAIVAYPVGSQIPTDIAINDIEVDITPAETRVVASEIGIKDPGFPLAYHQEAASGSVPCPPGEASYRYTVNKAETKVPAGIVKGLHVTNDNAWADAGAYDPQKVQGDLLFAEDCTVQLEYMARALNEGGTDAKATFWLAKVEGDTLQEVLNSITEASIPKGNAPVSVRSKAFTFKAKAGESYRFMAQADRDDGFYLQGSPTTPPLFSWKAGVSVLQEEKA